LETKASVEVWAAEALAAAVHRVEDQEVADQEEGERGGEVPVEEGPAVVVEDNEIKSAMTKNSNCHDPLKIF
jgi:hypothetical protein